MKTFAATASAILFSVGAVASASAADLGGGVKEPVPYYAPSRICLHMDRLLCRSADWLRLGDCRSYIL